MNDDYELPWSGVEDPGVWDDILNDYEKQKFVEDNMKVDLEPFYSFDTHIREYDGVEVHSITGIPAEEYAKINVGKIKDTL